MEHFKPALFGFLLSSTLGWGDLGNALVLGFFGALGGLCAKFLYDLISDYFKNRNK